MDIMQWHMQRSVAVAHACLAWGMGVMLCKVVLQGSACGSAVKSRQQHTAKRGRNAMGFGVVLPLMSPVATIRGVGRGVVMS